MYEGSFEQEYFNVLFSIESCIYKIYSTNPELHDFSVNKVLDGLIRSYGSIQKGRKPPNLRFSKEEQTMFNDLQRVMNLYLGDGSSYMTTEEGDDLELPDQSITIDELIACFRRIQRSIKLMSDQGRQGYLNFIKVFFGKK